MVRRPYAVTAIAALGGLLYGFVLMVISGAIPFIADRFDLGNYGVGLSVSNLDIGAIAGAIAAGPLSDRFGRKKLLIATAILFALSFVVTAAAPSFTALRVGRIIGGVALGASMLSAVYIAEIAPANRRGLLVSTVQVAIVLGILLAACTNWFLVDAGSENWRWMFAVGIVPAAAFLGGLFFVPESPRWLAGRDAAPGDRIRLGELARPGMAKPLAIGIAIAIVSTSVGINAVLLYAPLITARGSVDLMKAELLTSIAVAAANVVFTLPAPAVIDRFGRKPLLLLGLLGMGGAMIWLAAWYGPDPGSAILIPMLVFVGCYAVSLGPVSWVLLSEMFPTRIRGAAMACCMIAMYGSDFAVTLAFPSSMEEVGRGAFCVFAAICFGAALFVIALVRETKGKSLEAI